MSWSETSPPLARGRRRVLAALAGCAGMGLLSGCGFRPLYGRDSETGASTVDELRAIRITPLEDRTGQIMHNLLRDRLNPRGQPVRPRYELTVSLTESILELALASDETATRGDLSIIASFTLTHPGEGRILLSGSSRAVNSFNILQSQFATQVSEQDARERGLRELSDEIRVQLGIYFTREDEGG